MIVWTFKQQWNITLFLLLTYIRDFDGFTSVEQLKKTGVDCNQVMGVCWKFVIGNLGHYLRNALSEEGCCCVNLFWEFLYSVDAQIVPDVLHIIKQRQNK